MKILVSPLGLSPGAVSGLYYALQRELEVKVEKVITIGTNDPKLRGCRRILEEVFWKEDVDYDAHSIPFADLRWPGAVRAFCKEVAATLTLAEEGDEIYLGISAGYGSMGALALLVARQNQEVDEVYHLWIDDELQQRGHIDRFGQLAPEDQEQVLQSRGGFLTVIPIVEGDQQLRWLTSRSSEHDGQLRQEEIESLSKQLEIRSRNRNRLQERAAAYSTEAPLKILNDIKAEEKAIRDIKARLDQLGARE
jgi:hypothetical protein